MNPFGELLRERRGRCRDPQTGRPLSQQRLGELIGQFLGDGGYSGQTISFWERGRYKPRADERLVLLGLVSVLNHGGGLATTDEANELLAAGNYRALAPDEAKGIFGPVAEASARPSAPPPVSGPKPSDLRREIGLLPMVIVRGLRRWRALRRRIAQFGRRTPPSWPHLVVWLLRLLGGRLSRDGLLRALYWLGLWAIHGYLTEPLFQWPFPDRQTMLSAVRQYAGASLALPLLIGLAIDTRANPAWRARGVAGTPRVWLFTWLGASMGYAIGFMVYYWASLAGAALGLGPIPVLAQLGALLPVTAGVWAAHLIADNLWLAYGQLSPRANWVLFAFLGFGCFWAFFFVQLNDMFPSPQMQLLLWVAAVVVVEWQAKRVRHQAPRAHRT
jgi:hypothetical protein